MIGSRFIYWLILLTCTTAAACDTIIPGSNNNGGKVVWSQVLQPEDEIHVNNTQPVINDGKIYVVETGKLTCYELESGKTVWKTDLRIRKGHPGRELLLDGERLYINGSYLVDAVNANTGKIIWSTRLYNFAPIDRNRMTQNATHLFVGGRGEIVRLRKSDGKVNLRIPVSQLEGKWPVEQPAYDIVAYGGIVYVPTGYSLDEIEGSRGNALAYDAETGAFIWGYHFKNRKQPLPEYGDTLTLGAASYAVAVGKDVAVFPSGLSIVALSRHTGGKLWEYFDGKRPFHMGISIHDNVVYAGGRGGPGLNTCIFAFELGTGERLWRSCHRDLGNMITIIEWYKGRLYFDDLGQLWVLDAGTGEIIWHSFPPDYPENRHDTYLAPVAVGEGFMAAVGAIKIYALSVPQ